jgi:hypothetical protein
MLARRRPSLSDIGRLQIDTVPPWVDWELLDRGGAVFLRSGGLGIAALSLAALPLSYASGVGNKPLVFTGHLLRRAPRRLAETARFTVATSQPGGLRRFAPGFKFTVKVRLMHAQVRRLLWGSGRWNPEWAPRSISSSWPEPISSSRSA